MRDIAGSAAAPAARCRNLRRGNFILNLPLPSHHSITSSASNCNDEKMPRLLSGPVGRPRSRQDFLQFCFVGRKLSLQISFQKMKPIISPEDLAVHYKGRNPKSCRLNGTLRLKTKPLLDLIVVGLAQQLFPVEPHAIGNLINNAIRSDISSLAPRRIEKAHGKRLSKIIVVDGRCNSKRFEGIKGVSRGTLKLQSQVDSPTLRILKRITALGGGFPRDPNSSDDLKALQKERAQSETWPPCTCAPRRAGAKQ